MVKYSDLSAADISRIELFKDEVLDWKIVDITDLNRQSGFYACTIETDKKNAIVAFRGSESKNIVKDWISADFGLINSTETEQQSLAEAYADILSGNDGKSRNKIGKYENIGVTGHSLGGNLAEHFTIKSAKLGREELYSRIKQCDSLDGPGFSEKYITDRDNLMLMNK